MATRKGPVEPVGLGEFEGKEIDAIKVIVQKTGDGLSKAMDVEPKILHQGDTGYIVIAYRAEKIRFDPSKDAEEKTDRVQILVAEGATFVDADLVGNVVTEMRERIKVYEDEERKRKEEEKGIFRFEDEGNEEENGD